MFLKPTTREHFDMALSLPHERKLPTADAAWYATEGDRVLAEIDFDPTSERWHCVVYTLSPDGWQEVDHNGAGYYDLDDAERALLDVAAALSQSLVHHLFCKSHGRPSLKRSGSEGLPWRAC